MAGDKPDHDSNKLINRPKHRLNVQHLRLDEPSGREAAESREDQEQPHLHEGGAADKDGGLFRTALERWCDGIADEATTALVRDA